MGLSKTVTVRGVFDLGSSVAKCVYSVEREGGDDVRGCLMHPSRILPLHSELHDESLDEENTVSAVVRLSNGSCWIVGERAGNAQTNARVDKSMTAAAKVVAVVGQMLKKIQVGEGETIELEIAVLLPVGEQAGFVGLAKTIFEELYGAEFNGRPLDVVMSNPVRIYAEGAGLASLVVDDSVMLGFGHKDVSIIPVQGQSLAEGSTCLVGWGMGKILKASPVPIMDDVRGAHAFFRYLLNGKEEGLRELFQGRADVVIDAIPKIVENYWLQLSHSINSMAEVATAEKLYIGGGNAPIMLPLAAQYLKKKCEARILIAPVIEYFGESFNKKTLAFRLSDPTAMHLKLWGKS